MNKDNKYIETFKTWEKVAELYQDKFMSLDIYSESYKAFLTYLDSTAKVLDVACGPGNISYFLQNQCPTIKIHGIDISNNMLDLARKNVPNASFSNIDIRNLDEIVDTFDGIICGFAFPYLSRNDIEKFIDDSTNLLNKKGILYLSFVEGDTSNSGFIKGSTSDRMFFYYHSKESITSLLNSKGYKLLRTETVIYSDGHNEEHQILIAQKSG